MQPTYRERDILNYINKYQNKHGCSPTLSEIADGIITSRSFVRYAIYRLELKGFLTYDEHRHRSIVIRKNETA